jgi:hypothetical protein
MISEGQIKHLEFIQAVVARLARNSFTYKGWAITLVAAVFALTTKTENSRFLLVAGVPAIFFWGLDAYYLRQERLFRHLYDAIRQMPLDKWNGSPFVMDTSPYADKVSSWFRICWSGTIAWLYGPMVLLVGIVTALAFAGKLINGG